MSHLDEGTLTAMLDGEIPSGDLPPITTHLGACAECRTLLDQLRGLATEADTLVAALGDGTTPAAPPVPVAPRRAGSRTTRYRQLAWAATIVLAWGLGNWTRDRDGNSVVDLTDTPLKPPAAQMRADAEEPDLTSPAAGPREQSRREPMPPGRAAEAGSPPAARTPAAAKLEPTATREISSPVARIAAGIDPESAAVAVAGTARRQEAAAGATELRAPGLRATASPAPSANLAEASRDRQEVAVESFLPIGFVEAVARMGGTLRLVDGLVPDRLEASMAAVRVIYPLQTGELVLEQRRLGDSIGVALRGPLSAESLAVLRRRVR